jgi:hypothetical protein
MAGTGGGQLGWAAKLKASLSGAEPPPPVIEEPAPAEPSPPPEPDPVPESAIAEPAAPAPQPEPPPPPEPAPPLPDPASAYSLLQALTAPPAEPAPPPAPKPPAEDVVEPPLPALFQAAAQPEAMPPPVPATSAADAAELPLPVLFHAVAAPPEPAPRPPLQGGYTLLDLAPPPAPAPEAPRPTLLEALPPKVPEAALFPMLSALQAAPPAGAEPPPAPLRPSPLLDALRTTPPDAAPVEPAPAPTPSAEAPGPKPLPEREVRAVFELLVGRPPQEAELAPLRGLTRRMALRSVILGGEAFREAVLAPAIAAAPRPGNDAVPPGAEALDALGAGAAAEPGMVLDWFGLRTPAAIAPELAAHAGRVLPKPVPSDPRAPSAEWIGLAASLAAAGGTWRGLSAGAGRGDLLLAGGVAARRRGLAIELHATEPSPAAFAALLQHAGANGIEPGKGRFRQARIGTDPDRRPAGGALLQELLAEAAPWDWVRLGQRGALGPLLKLSTPLLTERVRILSLVTHSRSEEAVAIRHLARAGWQLVAEQPVRLSLADPAGAEQAGAQVWRGPLA